MPRIRKTGAVYPIRHEQRKTLKDGTVKTYVNWQAKVDGRWVSAKTYKECDRKIVFCFNVCSTGSAVFFRSVC